jgi:hypothetical protein
MIPRNVHGVLDYIVGLLLIASPWVFGFADGTAAQHVPVALGVGALLYSLLTNYELGLIRVIPFSVHLMLDFASGVFLAASPWLLGFADRVNLPHVILGVLEIGAAAMTRRDAAPVHAPADGLRS